MKAKKIIALLLCIVTVFTLCPVTSFAVCADGEHNYQWETTMQTCSADGKHEYKCTLCGDVADTEVIPAHNYSVVFTGKIATCTEQGSVTLYCSWCRQLKNQITLKDPENHLYGEWITEKEPTCKTEGKKYRLCLRDGCSVKEEVIIPIDVSKHVADENSMWTTVQAPTCYAVGIEKTNCTVCSASFTREIPVHYDYTDTDKYSIISQTKGNCTVAAYTVYHCKSCKTSFTKMGEKNPTAHDFSDESIWEHSQGASCKNPGTVIKHCKNTYAHTVTEVYAPHDFSGEETVVTPVTCTTDGQKKVQCLYCDETKLVTVPAEHVLGDWVINPGGNCKYGGTASRSCPCGEVKEENVEFEGGTHLNYTVQLDVKPTCKYLGYQMIKCKICNEQVQYFPEEYAAKGHRSSTWFVATPATCQSSGIERRVCLDCDEVIAENVLVQLAHSCIILEEGIEATCTTDGITPYLYCTLCQSEFEQETVKAYGHNFVEQSYDGSNSSRICDRCYQYEIDGSEETCDCMCHNSNGLAKTIFKFIVFFYKIFGIKQECDCGALHYQKK